MELPPAQPGSATDNFPKPSSSSIPCPTVVTTLATHPPSSHNDLLDGKDVTHRPGTSVASTSPPPVLSGTPDLHSKALSPTDASQYDPEENGLFTTIMGEMMFARTKANLPHQQKMENVTWRMIALALKKKRDEEMEQERRASEPERMSLGKSVLQTLGPLRRLRK